MPRVRWGISSRVVDDFDRDQQYKPYMGPVPPNAVYQWKVKQLKSVAGTRDKNPQLRVGLELIPRKGRDEGKYSGYFVMAFLPVTDKTNFRYTPFLDALGVSGTDFTERTIADEEGNVKKIGRWRNDGSTLILGQLTERPDDKGVLRKDITWMGALDETPEGDDDEDSEDYDDDDDDDEFTEEVESKRREIFGDDADDADDADEDEPAPRRRRTAPAQRDGRVQRGVTAKRTAPSRRHHSDEEDPF